MKGERLQSLPDTCTKPLLSLYFISLLFPERGREKREESTKEKEGKDRETQRGKSRK